jgi:hypothetical protein
MQRSMLQADEDSLGRNCLPDSCIFADLFGAKPALYPRSLLYLLNIIFCGDAKNEMGLPCLALDAKSSSICDMPICGREP